MTNQMVGDGFDAIMGGAFPGGIPQPEAVVTGSDHTAYHFLECIIQAYDMLGCYADLNELVDTEACGWAVVQEHPGRFSDALNLIRTEPRPSRELNGWVREAGAAAALALANWLYARGIPQVYLWVYVGGHGFIPFIVQARDPQAVEPMQAGTARPYPRTRP